jgi:hypothetical protein
VTTFINQIATWLTPVLLLTLWFAVEIHNRIRIRRGTPPRKLLGWFFRPWAAWACVNLVYQLNPGKGMDAVETAPTFSDWLFPLFIAPWIKTESFTDVVSRLVTTPTVYGWGAVVAFLALLLVLLIRRVVSDRPLTPKWIGSLLLGLFVLISAIHLSVASLPNGAWDSAERKGSLLSCWNAQATMLYAKPFVKSTDHFMENFPAIQRRLRFTIHAYSHPPGGTLSMHYIGCLAGAKEMNIRLDSTRIRYTLGMTLFAALNLFIVFGLGRSIFGTAKHGLVAAILWGVSPAVMGYSNHAQDGLYAVFFNLGLLLTWRIGMARRPKWLEMAGLGLVFSCLNFMNYSWVLITSIFALFLLYRAFTAPWTIRELLLRGIPPLGIMTVVSGSILWHYQLDYLAAYQVASGYVAEWYQYETIYQHVIAWIGGQVEIGLMMGALTCSAFLAAAGARIRQREWSPAVVFLGIILAIYILPVLFGPNCLRLETARCWLWVPSVPMCFAACMLLNQSRPRFFVTAAALASLISYSLMRLIINVA